MTEDVGRPPQYDVFADEFRLHAEDGFFNAHYDRPTCLRLLGDVTGKTVLDAACGPGLYARELLRRGARVVGFDQSPRMIEICRETADAESTGYMISPIHSPGCRMRPSTWRYLRWPSSTSMTGSRRCGSCTECCDLTALWCCPANIPPATGCATTGTTSTSE